MAAAAARAAAAASAALAALKPTPASTASTNIAPPWANLSGAAPGAPTPAQEALPDDLQSQRGHFQLGKKICALCKRKFPSTDKLFQHARKSALHKKNLELLEIKRIADADRAARSKPPPRRTERPREDRRRNKKRQEASGPSAFEEMVSKAASVKKPIDDSNKGSKMLKAMGWKKGQGLGKDSRGRTAPVEAEIHVRGAGLGSAPSGRNAILPGDNYQNAGIKKARARFERAGSGFSSSSRRPKKQTSAASAYLAAMNEYQSTMCTEKDEYARAMLK
uniref:G-patch domain-containing protein n=1 Tax=Lotharella oceanica TaxID=641309 RepID=A0A7S2XDK9_9EUKA|mmetsp:Transcript_31572/g.58883  ORF Transcript_31572/g.58883 Transcript_31572/m.58883 type:complete len:278 (+) Transcript_31572:909-1742(+)